MGRMKDIHIEEIWGQDNRNTPDQPDTSDADAELAGILAARDAIDAARRPYADRCAGRAARLTREVFPTAETLTFGVASHGGEDILEVLEVRDDTGALLWSGNSDATPPILDKAGDVTDLMCHIYNSGPANFLGSPDRGPEEHFDGDVCALNLREALDTQQSAGGQLRAPVGSTVYLLRNHDDVFAYGSAEASTRHEAQIARDRWDEAAGADISGGDFDVDEVPDEPPADDELAAEMFREAIENRGDSYHPETDTLTVLG